MPALIGRRGSRNLHARRGGAAPCSAAPEALAARGPSRLSPYRSKVLHRSPRALAVSPFSFSGLSAVVSISGRAALRGFDNGLLNTGE